MPIFRLCHGALVSIDFEPQTFLDKSRETRHDSFARTLAAYVDILVSRPGESHPQPLSEPYVNLSAHTAPIIQPVKTGPGASAQTTASLVSQRVPAIVGLWCHDL